MMPIIKILRELQIYRITHFFIKIQIIQPFILYTVKKKLQLSFRQFSILILGISMLSSCSSTMVSERGTAGNSPARTYAKNSSKAGITTLPLMPNSMVKGTEDAESTLDFSSKETLNPETKTTANRELNLNTAEMTISADESINLPDITSHEKTKPTVHDSRKSLLVGNHYTPKTKLKSGVKKKIRVVNSFVPLRIKQSGRLANRTTKQEFIPDSSSDVAKWLLFALGIGLLIIIGGYGALMAVFAVGWGESVSFALSIFLISLIPGLFYLWASYLYDNLEDHSILYQIGFWGTITILPAIIALPLWIFAAIRDAINDGDFDEITSLILNAFAWIILIFGEIFSIVTTMYYIYWGF